MQQLSSRQLENFKSLVGTKFQLYNSLFTSLPFHRVEKTGILLSLFLNTCEEGYAKGSSPLQIVDEFFNRFTTFKNDKERTDLLLRFIQYVERQVVLFDALEDASFREITDLVGVGSFKQLENKIHSGGLWKNFEEKLQEFNIALVLTAHPTQFYTGPVLGIINDLARALKENNTNQVNMYLQQLGKTPLSKKQKPTPYDEAISLIWYLENVFYNALGKVISNLKEQFSNVDLKNNTVIRMGFWPGGDRDGNPNVTVDITLKVAEALRSSIIKCYYLDIRKLKRRLTFNGVDVILGELEGKLYRNIFIPDAQKDVTQTEITAALYQMREILVYQHNGLFLPLLDNLINKVAVFGIYFATLDVRQESSVHNEVLEAVAEKEDVLPKNYAELTEEDKIGVLLNVKSTATPSLYDGLVQDSLQTVGTIKAIQQMSGEKGCDRYIISQCNSALNVMEVYGLFLLGGWDPNQLTVDIVPLFETIDDLSNAPSIMAALYQNKTYHEHLLRRGKKQTIMVGFSDGTKDGGYLMANWSIFKAKQELTQLSREHGIDVIFFDGRGGPPARGGGKTHKFYASMGKNISTKEIHLTIQGQTVSSNFGTPDSAQFNMEQLLNAGITNELFSEDARTLNPQQEETVQQLADSSLRAYKALKEHPDFLSYLAEVSPLNYYSETNISSRPSKRGKGSRLSLRDLRAIPFVGAWSQLKQNVPGFYGLGTALEELEKEGKLDEIKHLYSRSQYFKTLMDNCEMAMRKTFFPLTSHLSKDPQYGELWNLIYEEFVRTEKYLFKLSGSNELMHDYPVERLSIQMRERIVMPLTTIQQYALTRLREEKGIREEDKKILERLVVRTSFGIINAGRNSV
jgi:phosphoenolpyruvate carboxylase